MDRNVESYKSEKAKLISTLEKLKERVHTVEAYDLLMKLKTEGYLKAIQDLKHPFTACSFYLIRWFRTFVGVKDEAMLLINGELMRNYHRKVHEQHLHTRGKESSYYKTGVLGLSSCSVDGMNYQFRMLAMKRKKNDCREEERMDAVGDQIRDLETRLDMLCKTVDAHVSVVKSELKKKCPYIRSITIESTYKAEHLSLHYDPKITPLRDFQYTCQEARTGSRKLALHSGIEDPTSEGVAVQRLVAPIGHHRAAVADEEDQEYARQMAQQRAAATLAEQRASELEAQKVPDFSFDYSIDKEKREFGAYELLAIPEDRDDDDVVIVEDSASGRYVTEVGGDGDGDGDGDKYDDEVVWHFRPEPLNLRLSPLRTSRLLKVKLIPQEASSTGAGPEILMRTVLPGTDIAVFRHRDTRLLSHIHLTVEINATTNFAELKQLHHLVGNTTPTTTAVEVRVAQVLEEVQRQLWLGCSAEEVLLVTDLLHLPCALRINNKDYGSDDTVALPEDAELKKKRYLVKIDTRSCTTSLLCNIATWLRSRSEVSTLAQARSLLWSQRVLVQRLVDRMENRSPTQSIAGGPPMFLWLGDPDLLLPPLVEDEDMNLVNSFFEVALPKAAPELVISISASNALCGYLPLLLIQAVELQAASCGIAYSDLLQCAAHFRRGTRSSRAHSEAAQHLQSECVQVSAHVSHPLPALRRVDLSHNHFLSYCDAPWELLLLHTLTAGDSGDSGKCGKEAASCEDNDDGSEPMDLDLNGVGGGFLLSSTATQTLRNSADPFEQFAIELFVQCVSLDSVDLSHCATSEKQAHYLCEGLVQAVKARASKGHSAVRNIVLSGFDTEFPGIIDSLKNALADIGFANTVDCSGVNLCI